MKMITSKQALDYLIKSNYKYKGRSITRRTVRTMIENGVIQTELCICGNRIISVTDLDNEINKQGEV